MRVKGPGRDLKREGVWRAVLERQRQSGLSIRAFCRREGISEPSFYAWRRELLRRDRESLGVTEGVSEPRLGSPARRPSPAKSAAGRVRPSVTAAFLPVTITASESGGRVLEVSCADGLRLSVWPGCDAALLQATLSVLTTQAIGRRHGEAVPC